MITKKFNKSVHDACDPPARQAVINYFKTFGVTVKDHPNQYDVDLLLISNGEPYASIEVETRPPDLSKYKTIHIAERKGKLLKTDLPLAFFVLTADFSHAWVTNSINIQNSPLREVPNTAVSKGERFYDVPIGLWKYVALN